MLYRRPLKPIPAEIVESGRPAADELKVVVEAPDLCPRFCARVLDVRVGPSPAWIRERLEKVGVRPISTVVDLTNYERKYRAEGRPIHRARYRRRSG